ncbi:MAG: DUF2785 domain-containing protein [Syntrophaceae bacterium]|nr:DUF2785 domain-containing protein [Syntrophaceae bacterium]
MRFETEEKQFKTALARLRQEGYGNLSSSDMDDLINGMVTHIGSPDSELRDDLIYRSFGFLILKDRLDAERIFRLLETCSGGENLTFNIDSEDYRHVFRRSFSMLVVALILEWDLNKDYLDEKTFRTTASRILRAYNSEKIIRGYYADEGWAHTVAHSADAFCLLVAGRWSDESMVREILESIGSKICRADYYYIDGEDERTAEVIRTIEKKDSRFKNLLKDWLDSVSRISLPETQPGRSILKGNLRNFLRSIYFKINDGELKKHIEELLSSLRFT